MMTEVERAALMREIADHLDLSHVNPGLVRRLRAAAWAIEAEVKGNRSYTRERVHRLLRERQHKPG